MLWGAGAIVLSLLDAIHRLGRFVVEGVTQGLMTPFMLTATVVWCVVIVYFEGIRGFKRALAPRIAARLWLLAQHGSYTQKLLAPLHALSLFDSTPRRKRISWALLTFVIAMILIVRKLPQPYRASVDLGVVLALGLGVWTIVHECILAVRNKGGRVDAEMMSLATSDEKPGALRGQPQTSQHT